MGEPIVPRAANDGRRSRCLQRSAPLVISRLLMGTPLISRPAYAIKRRLITEPCDGANRSGKMWIGYHCRKMFRAPIVKCAVGRVSSGHCAGAGGQIGRRDQGQASRRNWRPERGLKSPAAWGSKKARRATAANSGSDRRGRVETGLQRKCRGTDHQAACAFCAPTRTQCTGFDVRGKGPSQAGKRNP